MLTSDQLLGCHLALYGNAKDFAIVVMMQTGYAELSTSERFGGLTSSAGCYSERV